MNQRYGLHNYTNCILLTVLTAAMVCGMAAPAFADSKWLLNGIAAMNAPSSHETAREERLQAVEKAKVSLKYAALAGGEKVAPFEYYMAEKYFRLAAEELGSGDKIGVVEFAQESVKYSLAARVKAKERSSL